MPISLYINPKLGFDLLILGNRNNFVNRNNQQATSSQAKLCRAPYLCVAARAKGQKHS